MQMRAGTIFLQAMVAIMLTIAPAWAVTIAPGSTTALEPSENYSYTAILSSNAVVNDTFNFTVADPLGTSTTAIALNAGGAGALGVKNLTIKWYTAGDFLLGTLLVTNSAGLVLDPMASLVLGLATGAYKVIATGQALANGGIYNINVATTPLPPALILFGTALVGMTFLGRRRRRQGI